MGVIVVTATILSAVALLISGVVDLSRARQAISSAAALGPIGRPLGPFVPQAFDISLHQRPPPFFT